MSIETIQFAPEFDGFSREALQSCMDVGAAVMRNFLSQESLQQLQASHPTDFVGFMNTVLELRAMRDGLAAVNPSMGGKMPKDSDTGKLAYDRWGAAAHVDVDIPRDTVFSLLLPLSGDPAIFAADKLFFDLGHYKGKPLDFVTWYGQRDGMLLRQSVNWIDGQQRQHDRKPLYHVGISPTNRRLAIVDVTFPQNSLFLPAA